MTSKLVVFENSPNLSAADKENLIKMLEYQAEMDSRLCVIYNPDCGCPIDQFAVLDRYPMSEKIMCRCPHCKKGCYMEISDPIVFHDPINVKDITLSELKNYVVMSSSQCEYIKRYQYSSPKKSKRKMVRNDG